jgi:hypothetical protein
VKTCYQLQYTDLKRLDPDSQPIETAASTAPPPVKRNGLSEEKCEFSGEKKKSSLLQSEVYEATYPHFLTSQNRKYGCVLRLVMTTTTF